MGWKGRLARRRKENAERISRIWKRWRGQDGKTRPTSPRRCLCLCLASAPPHIRAAFAAHTAQAGPRPTRWLQLLHINTATEGTGRGRREKMEGGAAPHARLPPVPQLPGGSRARNRLAQVGPAHLLCHLTQAMTGFKTNTHTKNNPHMPGQTDTLLPASLRSCQTPTYLLNKASGPGLPTVRAAKRTSRVIWAPCTNAWQAGLLHSKR